MAKRICVIGAGASGICCVKECVAVGLDVVCYEKVEYTGGLWRYHESDEDGIASVTRATVINSSKEMSAYSDFPPPKELPNYCHNAQLVQYFDSYADHFGVRKYVHFRHEVLRVTQNSDYEETGRWKVRVRNNETDSESEDVFDGVLVCTGHHVKPFQPSFKDQDKFRGKIIHTHSYKRPNGFEDQNVAVVGVGNSGVDAAVELSMVAKQVHLSTRRGTWVLIRVGPDGVPFDMLYLRRMYALLQKVLPYTLICSVIEKFLNSRFDHEKYGLKPAHRVWSQHPTVNDALPNRILSGTVRMKGDIVQFTETGVLFDGDKQETPLDAVVLATGYEVSFPFLDASILDTTGNHCYLYKYAFNPNLTHPETLCFIGLAQPTGPLIPISELQARWFCQLIIGQAQLPAKSQMRADIDQKRAAMAKRYYAGPRHTLQVDWCDFMDQLAAEFGVKPNLWTFLFTDPVLWWHLLWGPLVPYQFRLVGPGRWDGARTAILTVKERVLQALATRPLRTAPASTYDTICKMIAEFLPSHFKL